MKEHLFYVAIDRKFFNIAMLSKDFFSYKLSNIEKC